MEYLVGSLMQGIWEAGHQGKASIEEFREALNEWRLLHFNAIEERQEGTEESGRYRAYLHEGGDYGIGIAHPDWRSSILGEFMIRVPEFRKETMSLLWLVVAPKRQFQI